jgi:hypothetical protein
VAPEAGLAATVRDREHAKLVAELDVYDRVWKSTQKTLPDAKP